VQTPPDQNGNALIRAGIMSITAHVSNIRLVDEQRAISKNAARSMDQAAGAGTGAGASPRALNVRAELDVRGARLEGAVSQVDHYLSDVSSAGLNEVAIIHGKGTGALRAGIQDFLRGHPKVKSFRNGNYGEGDMGVTIISVKL
jgi:DNA mismatch repair protein MutS2